MKRMMCIMLSAAMLLCGCQSADLIPGETQTQTEEMTETGTQTELEIVEMETPGVTLPIGEQETGAALEIGRTDRVRIAYTGNRSCVQYVTSVEDLPDNEALAAYDAAYFETGALLIVTETVSSGSVKVDIESVEDGVVTLSHRMSGDAGTADMATWLLWAEVEAGLEYSWSVANPALPSAGSAY